MSDGWDVAKAVRVLEERLGGDGAVSLGVLLRDAREDADRRLEAFQAAVSDQIAALRAEMREGFAAVDRRFGEVERRFAVVEQGVAVLRTELSDLKDRVSDLKAEVSALRRPWWDVATQLGTAAGLLGVLASLAIRGLR